MVFIDPSVSRVGGRWKRGELRLQVNSSGFWRLKLIPIFFTHFKVHHVYSINKTTSIQVLLEVMSFQSGQFWKKMFDRDEEILKKATPEKILCEDRIRWVWPLVMLFCTSMSLYVFWTHWDIMVTHSNFNPHNWCTDIVLNLQTPKLSNQLNIQWLLSCSVQNWWTSCNRFDFKLWRGSAVSSVFVFCICTQK